MLDLYELQVFLLAAETENFSETGRMLGISQPAVSGHIQALERRLHTRLFDRTGRNIKLNEVGRAFVPVVRNLMKEVRQAEEFIASRQGVVGGQLTIGCSTACGKYILPQIMSRFLDHNPDVRITCQVEPRGRALEHLRLGEIDLAVSSLRVPRKQFEYRHFSDDVLVLIVPPEHPWADRSQLEPDDLVEYPLVMREPSSGTSITLNRELAKYDMSADILQQRLVVGNSEAIVQAVSSGIAPAFVSRVAVAAYVEKGLVVEVPVGRLQLVMRLYMVRHTGFHTSEAQNAFWEFTFAPENQDLLQLFSEGSA
ncbi:MAG: LysR family transcriptional regulator [Anaerolineae bacterium]|nr:LysR family transcriptional regulator [Anaerolineae bacterium]